MIRPMETEGGGGSVPRATLAGVPASVAGVATGGGAMLLASIVGNGVSFLFGVLVARRLGPAAYGLYALGWTIFSALVLIVPLGLDTAVVRFAARHLGLNRPERARGVVRRALGIALVSGLIAAAGLAFAAAPLAVGLYREPALAGVLLGLALALPAAVVGNVLLHAFEAFGVMRYTVALKYVWEPGAKLTLAAILIGLGFGLAGVVTAIVISLIAGLALVVPAGRRLIGGAAVFERGDAAALTEYAAPLVVTALFGVIAPRSDMLLLGYWAGAEELGRYGAAFQLAASLALVLGGFDAAFAPAIGRALARGDGAELARLYQAVCRWSITLALPGFLVLAICADFVLGWFGVGFAAAAGCLTLLAAGQVANAACGAANTVLLMSGRSRLVMWNTIGFGLALLAINALAVPRFGALGAAAAAAISIVALNGLRTLQVWRATRMLPWNSDLLRPLAAGTIAAAAGVSMRAAFGPGAELLTAAALTAVYGIALAAVWPAAIDRTLLRALVQRWIPESHG